MGKCKGKSIYCSTHTLLISTILIPTILLSYAIFDSENVILGISFAYFETERHYPLKQAFLFEQRAFSTILADWILGQEQKSQWSRGWDTPDSSDLSLLPKFLCPRLSTEFLQNAYYTGQKGMGVISSMESRFFRIRVVLWMPSYLQNERDPHFFTLLMRVSQSHCGEN